MLRCARDLFLDLRTIRLKDAFVAEDELIGTLVDVELLLRPCYDLMVVRLRLMDKKKWEDPTMLFVTFPVLCPAFQFRIERRFWFSR